MALQPAQLTAIRAALDERYRTLIAEVREELAASENYRYADVVNRDPADPGDEAIGDLLADLGLAEIDRHIREIREIEAARQRFQENRADNCTDCGREIGYQRLLVCPTATRCLQCQQQHEHLHAGEATPRL
jgi:DnaK suppressor protein